MLRQRNDPATHNPMVAGSRIPPPSTVHLSRSAGASPRGLGQSNGGVPSCGVRLPLRQGPGMRPQQVRICTDGSGLARLDSRRGSRSARRRYGGDDWRLVGELRCATPSTGSSIPCSLVLTSTDTNGASGESNRGSQSYSSSERFSASASWPQLRSRSQTTTRSSLSRPQRRGRHLRVLRW